MSTSLHFLFILQRIIRRSCQGHQRSPLLINPIVNSHILSYLISTVFDKLSLLYLRLVNHFLLLLSYFSTRFPKQSVHAYFFSLIFLPLFNSLIHRYISHLSVSQIYRITFHFYIHLRLGTLVTDTEMESCIPMIIGECSRRIYL